MNPDEQQEQLLDARDALVARMDVAAGLFEQLKGMFSQLGEIANYGFRARYHDVVLALQTVSLKFGALPETPPTSQFALAAQFAVVTELIGTLDAQIVEMRGLLGARLDPGGGPWTQSKSDTPLRRVPTIGASGRSRSRRVDDEERLALVRRPRRATPPLDNLLAEPDAPGRA